METNYYGPLLLSRAFAPVLAKNGGGITLNQAKTSIKLAQAWPLIQIPAVGRDIEGARCSLGRYGTDHDSKPMLPAAGLRDRTPTLACAGSPGPSSQPSHRTEWR